MRPSAKRLLAAVITATVIGTAMQATAVEQDAPRSSSAPEKYRYLKAQIFTVPGLGRVAVGAPDPARVMVQNFDETSQTWEDPTVLYHRKGVTCGEIAGRASAGGVALILECDTPYYEDTAPAHSVALVSRNLQTWRTKVLPGEAYQDPAISPDGRYAAWLAGGLGDYVLWSTRNGFAPLRSTTFASDGGGPTVVVDDTGTVSVIGPEGGDQGCVLGIHTQSLTGVRTRTFIDDFDPGCTEGQVSNIDAFTVVGGYDRPQRYVVKRADASSPWKLDTIAPAQAPGFVDYRGNPRQVIYQSYSDVPGQPLLSIGSPDRRRIFVQTYDAAVQTWGSARVIYDHGFAGCTSQGSFYAEKPERVHAIALNCYPRRRASGNYPPYDDNYLSAPRYQVRMLVSAHGTSWRTINIGAHPVGISANRSLLAVPGQRSTTIVSPSGLKVLPVREAHPCGALFPIAADRLLRLHGGPGATWPRVLQRYDGHHWTTIQKVPMPKRGSCRHITTDQYGSPTTYILSGDGKTVTVRIVRVGKAWRVVRARLY